MKRFIVGCLALFTMVSLWAQNGPIISEFMASNSKTLLDDYDNSEDWIEVANTGPTNVNLYNWSLTDTNGNLFKWRFPATNLPPGAHIIVFASNRDRHTAGKTLHTNFKLDPDGEYLALVRPDGSIATQFSPTYPPQVTDVSYGFSVDYSSVLNVTNGSVGRVQVPLNGGLAQSWVSNSFNDASWTKATNGIGFGAGTYAPLIKTDLRSAMSNVNASAYFRLPFVLTNTFNIYQAVLRMKFDDGFQAYLNGTPVAASNALSELDWNSTATSMHNGTAALTNESFDITAAISALRAGTNVLAFQGLNLSAANSNFLLSAELELDSFGYLDQARYFVVPTPGTTNSVGAKDLGPIMTKADFFPQLPGTNDSLTITCRVTQAFAPVTNVMLYWRVMFGATNATRMLDDGLHGDGAAGDGVYGAVIAKTNYSAGQMVRWYFSAADSLSRTSRWPFFLDPTNYAEYLGTVIQANYVTSSIPILHLFAPTSVLQPGTGPGGWTSQTGADSDAGGRVSAYFDGEFYDNIRMSLRGNSTAGFYKKSHRLSFNKEHPFHYDNSAKRITKTSFVAEYPDPTYLRTRLSYWLDDQVGVPPPFYSPMRLQLNGAFYELANHTDVQETEMLERIGYNPAGAYYANVGTAQPGGYSTGNFEKKTRLTEDNTDYNNLINALAPALSAGQKWTNLLDRLDLTEVISYMVAARFTHQNDDVWAGMALYHDNDGDDLWRILPYDQNLSWGAAYMDASVYAGIQATNDDVKSFPMYGSSQAIPSNGGGWNGMYDLIFQVPQTREMFRRSTRTMLDAYVKPPGTPAGTSPAEQKILQWRTPLISDAAVDRAWWGWPGVGGQCNFDPGINVTNGVNILLNDFFINRRNHFYGKHSVTNTALAIGITKTSNAGIPLAQPTNAVVSIIGWDYNPVSGNQDEEFVLLTNANNYAVDLSGWKLDGGTQFKFKFGTVIPTGGTLYVSPNTRAFRNRAVSPHGGEGRFVIGPYKGHLNAWGESLTIKDDTGRLVCSNSFVGAPSLAQQFLRVTEIMYNPSPAPALTNDEQLFEYIELRNILTNLTLDLTGCRFTNGIDFSFTGSAVTSLLPGQRVLVVRNLPAFTARYGGGVLIAGEFAGSLDNAGETLRLEDATGEKILDFAYNNSWYPITDGLGFSLVIVNDLASWDTWDKKSSWRASGALNGNPGAADPAAPAFPSILVNEVLAHTDLPDRDSVELFNPAATNVNLGGWFLTDDFYTPNKYRIPNGTTINAGGYLVFNDTQFNTGTNAFLFSEYGESAYLFSGDANTNLTGYYHGWDFKASPNGVSFGRYVDSQTNTQFVLQSTNTLGAANALPRVGPIVISEIMYHPPDLTNGVDNDLDEFIELQNLTSASAPLYCTFTNESGYGLAALTNTWQLRNAVDFDFPTNVTLAAGARLLVVGFNPTNSTQLAAFRSLYNVSQTVPIYGPWAGKLDNSGEQIELKYPDKPDVTNTNVFVPYVMVEQINYSQAAPWPTNADGLGNSLQRRVNSSFGNDPTNWFASATTAGAANVPNTLPTVSLLAPANGALFGRLPGITLSASPADADGTIADVSFYDGATLIVTLTSPPWNYLWTNAPFGTRSIKAITADNLGGIAQSAVVSITVTSLPPSVTLTSPLNGTNVVFGTPVTLSANATDSDGTVVSVDFYDNGSLLTSVPAPTFSYQWTPGSGGAHAISAIARDDSGATSPPASATVQVQAVLANPVLIPLNASWRYLDTGVNQGTNWIAPAFNDSSWNSGFGRLGFNNGNSGFNTILSYGTDANNKYPTTYFRRQFVVPTLVNMTNLVLEFQRDDGVAFYLNGTNLYRDNLPAGTLTYSQLATNCADNGATLFSVTLPTSSLIAGTNTLAAEVHQSSAFSSDLVFDARLTLLGTVVAPAIVSQPQSVTRTSGQPASFQVVVAGSTPVNYQWAHENTNLVGATLDALNLPAVSALDAGAYFVQIANAAGSVTSSVAMLTVILPDSDGDGMLDAWETANGLIVGVNDAALDPDHDGMSNLQEFLAHTDPHDAASVLALRAASAGNGQVALNFPAMANVTYTIQITDTLTPLNWQTWQQVVSAPTNRVVTLTNSPAGPVGRFFRIVTPAVP